MNVSRNQVQGSLADTPLERILAACKRHLITGVIKVTDGHRRTGRIELRAGAVDRAEIEGQSDATTMVKLEQFAGEYELEQQLPDLTGALGGAALAEGDVSGVPFVALMRHCEDHALTCTITVTRDDETIEIEYRAGEIKKITRNGAPDEDAIVDATRWTNARFRVSAPPLDMDVEGWPVVRPNTEPFTISDAAKAARADSAQPVPVKPAAPASPPASEVVVAKPVEAKKPEPAVEAKKPEPKPEPKPVEAKKPEPAKPEPAVEAKKPEPKPEPKPVEAKKPEPKPEPKPVEAKKPAAEAKPADEKKPAVETKPAAEEKKPAADAKPVEEKKPAADAKPVEEKKPAAEPKKPVETKPAQSKNDRRRNKRNSKQQKAQPAPAAAKEPAAEEKKPIAEAKPAEPKPESKPAEPKPAADEKKPAAEAKPAEPKPESKPAEKVKAKPTSDEKAIETVKIDRPAKGDKAKPAKEQDKAPEPAAARGSSKDRPVTAGNDRDVLWMVVAFIVLAAALGAVAFLL